MSCKLWQYFLQDDVESFKRVLATASISRRIGGGNAASPSKIGSPGTALGSSPSASTKIKRTGASPGSSFPDRSLVKPNTAVPLTRADVNAKDQHGRTLLHLVASSAKESALEFATTLLELPFLDIYAQDLESGWTALHRALYAGNAAIAHLLMVRDIRGSIDFSTPGGVHHLSGGLIKIKDREGNSPFDVFNATVLPRNIHQDHDDDEDGTDADDSSSTHSSDGAEEGYERSKASVRPQVNLLGGEVFTFGSNKNLSLGLGDEDDRQFPERTGVTRPDHLLYRFHHEYEVTRLARRGLDSSPLQQEEIKSVEELSTLIRSRPITFQDVAMSKLHTGIITNDPTSNLFMCGFGPGGRLGTGDEITRFNFVCIETGGLAGKKIVAVALGQDHSLAVTEQGEVFTWGTNRYGQLGYSLPKPTKKHVVPMQLTPRQIFNPFKKEVIIGAAASSIHSAVFTQTSLYTFGKNEGQLGFIDADARSLEYQTIPRRVGASLFNCPIVQASAIDRATICLLENHDVWVFTHYGYSRLVFPLDVSSGFIKGSFLSTRYGASRNYITKLTSGGNTICAMSSYGEVYAVNVSQNQDTGSSTSSTTNPSKIRNSLPQPSRVWSIKKDHMTVRDVNVGQDGSIIICTKSGSAWRKEKRAKMKDIEEKKAGETRSKDYKFVRIPGVNRVVAVRSNAFGAYAIVQRDSDVAKEQIMVDDPTIWSDYWPLFPFKDLLQREKQGVSFQPKLQESPGSYETGQRKKMSGPPDLEAELKEVLQQNRDSTRPQSPVWLSTTSSEVRIPVHEFILAARVPILRRALRDFHKSYYYAMPDLLSMEYDKNGQIQIQFTHIDLLSVFNLVLFLYSDRLYDIWTHLHHPPQKLSLYRQVRAEIIKLATQLELRTFERAARLGIQPKLSLPMDVDNAFHDPNFFDSGDVIIELDGAEHKAHSHVLYQRCLFFQGMFFGRAAGRWLSSRREPSADSDVLRIDLKHIDPNVFTFVLRHIYADTDDELFEDVQTQELEDFIDLVIDVMSVANELMLDRLAQICQKMLGYFVNTRNVCHLLNAVAPCSVPAFKQAALEYMCLNLEAMLENKLLDDLESDLFYELDEVCRENQLTCQPISRGRNSEEYMVEKYPELVSLIEQDKQRRIDSMKLRSRLHEDEMREEKFRVGSLDKGVSFSPVVNRGKPIASPNEPKSAPGTPLLKSKKSAGDLIFQMDDESLPYVKSSEAGPTQDPATDAEEGHLHYPPTLSVSHAQPAQSTSPFAAPWSSIRSSTAKTDLKTLLAEASGSQLPGRSPELTPHRESNAHGNLHHQKLSQKERRKLKQQQMQEALTEEETSKMKRSSPWQTVGGKSNEPSSGPEENTRRPASAVRSSSRSAMTLRQTVAGTPPQQQINNSSISQSRSSAIPAAGSHPPKTPPRPTAEQPAPSHTRTPHSPVVIPTSSPAQPRSVSYRAEPVRGANMYDLPQSGQLSLTSILQQQQFEKDEIHEAATAKHNLQDIQTEQEFQEWWDQECKRVQEAEAAEAAAKRAASGRHSSGNRGRGGGSTACRGRGRTNQRRSENVGGNSTADQQVTPQTSSAGGTDGRRRHSERGRGTGNSRGRGSTGGARGGKREGVRAGQ
ncbi:hypothetical protein AJ80_08834 [Polytolypa hystricis UAMH7299]|uniref:BTB domain-containing protein n=1 Tax=Polytolypa hystricis (strain UAMH7299) TaxID=1447883 RepID=A0A2B7X154_POLH7|nr:hypothetical protein AJ80_08834 [Polytolypa hystricis UAMH7299]